MSDPHVIAEIRDIHGWAGLVEAFRLACDHRQTSYEAVGKLAGLPDRYVNKLLSPRPMKAIGKISFGPLLGALGVKLTMTVDPDAAVTRLEVRKPGRHRSASADMQAMERHKRRRFLASDTARLMRQIQLLSSTPKQRRAIARKAAKLRWKKPRVTEIKSATAPPPSPKPAADRAAQRERRATSFWAEPLA